MLSFQAAYSGTSFAEQSGLFKELSGMLEHARPKIDKKCCYKKNIPLDLDTIRAIRNRLNRLNKTPKSVVKLDSHFFEFMLEISRLVNSYQDLELLQILSIGFEIGKKSSNIYEFREDANLDKIRKKLEKILAEHLSERNHLWNFFDITQKDLAHYIDVLINENRSSSQFFYPKKILNKNNIVIWAESNYVMVVFTGNSGFSDSLMSISDLINGNGNNSFIDLNGQANILSQSVTIINFFESSLKLNSYLEENLQMGKKIRFCAQGYNGALAELVAYYFYKKYDSTYDKQIESITFGVPGYLTEYSADKMHTAMGERQMRFRFMGDTIALSSYDFTFNQHGLIYFISHFDKGIKKTYFDKGHKLEYYRSNLLNTNFFDYIRNIFFFHTFLKFLRESSSLEDFNQHLNLLKELNLRNLMKPGNNLFTTYNKIKNSKCSYIDLLDNLNDQQEKLENYSENPYYHPEIKGNLEEKIIHILKNTHQLEEEFPSIMEIITNNERLLKLVKEESELYLTLLKAIEQLEVMKNAFLKELYTDIISLRNTHLSNRFTYMLHSLAKAKLALMLGKDVSYTDSGSTGTMLLKDIKGKVVGVLKKFENSQKQMAPRIVSKVFNVCRSFFNSYFSQEKSLAHIIDIQPKNEYLASMLAVNLKMYEIVPLSVITPIVLKNESHVGVFIEFIDSQYYQNAREDLLFLLDSGPNIDVFQEMVIWDFFIGNLDRKLENLLIYRNMNQSSLWTSPLYCIDNANIFPIEGPAFTNANMYSWGKVQIAQQQFTTKSKELVQHLLENKHLLQNVFSRVERLFNSPVILKDGADFLENRLNILHKILQNEINTPMELSIYRTRTLINKTLK